MSKALKELYSNPPSKRELVLYTGIKGAEAIDVRVKKTLVIELLKHNLKKFTPKEVISLTKMIESSDLENLELARTLIEQKK